MERLVDRLPAARKLGEGLKAALFVWAFVQSRPEPGMVIATMGKRDVGFDVTLPVPIAGTGPACIRRRTGEHAIRRA